MPRIAVPVTNPPGTMQILVFLIFVAIVVTVSRKLASIGSSSAGGPRTTGSARRRASSHRPRDLGNELADTLKAWVDDRGAARTTAPTNPYGETVRTGVSSSSHAPQPTPAVDVPVPPPLPLDLEPLEAPLEAVDTELPLESVRAAIAEEVAAAEAHLEPIVAPEPVAAPEPVVAPLASLEPLPAPDVELVPLDAPRGGEEVAGPSTETDAAPDPGALLADAVRAALDAPEGPELALSSSLSRPVSDAYTAVLYAGGFDEPSAESAFGRVAASSSFFGLTPTDRRRLEPARLVEALGALRRASPQLAAAFAADLDRLDVLVAGVPGSRAAVAVLRRLVPVNGDA